MLTKNEKCTQNFDRKNLVRRVTSEDLGAEILIIPNDNVLTGLIRSKEGRVPCKYG
jgi:hypothetical protein